MSLPHVRSAVVPITLRTAWKIPNKPSLNMHPRVPTKREGKKFCRIRKGYARICRKMGYVMDFTILENIETNIDPSLSNVVFGRPFVETACLAINRKYRKPSDLEDGFYRDTIKLGPENFTGVDDEGEVT
nr:hypothetical protein [Tanacetum cinerariifolium]